MKWLILVLLSTWSLFAQEKSAEQDLKQQIAHMLIIGFDAESLEASHPFVQEMRAYSPGGVILFDRDFHDRNRTKNIRSPEQLKRLTRQLNAFAPRPLLIAVDQEGGKVARLKSKYGFPAFPSAKTVGGRNDQAYAAKVYDLLAETLVLNGINTDFAPVVDLAVNPKNFVIYGLERSYGKTPQKVTENARIVLESLRRQGVVGVLKHFPGHGSSLGDSHEGFVDVTRTWSEKELIPYKRLIDDGQADMIMTAHVFNRNLDPKYPATLSYKVNTGLLRNKLGFAGVIVSDDLQMKAIADHYKLKETLRLAINAGVDMLLFGNQLGRTSLSEAVNAVYEEVRAGRISRGRILEANRRIDALMKQYGIGTPEIVDKPIEFGPKRVEMSREYIKQHYGLSVDSIEIDPKVIVLHWTADMGLESSFRRLEPEILPGSRGDIAKAGALNVSAHFLIDRNGTIYRLMPENRLARHVIGLNYSSIGIENVGGEGNAAEDLTPEQVLSNMALVRYLKAKYPGIRYLIGHHEYRRMESTPLWLERDAGYRTEKRDPGAAFMQTVRAGVSDLNFSGPPERR